MPFTRCCYQKQFSRIFLVSATTIMVSLFCEKVPLSFQPWQQIGNWAHPCLALLNFHFFPIWPVISVKTQFLRHLVPGTLTVQSTLWVCKEKSLYTRNCEKKLGWTKELKMRQPACSWDRLCWLFPPACRIIELCDLVWQSHYLGDNNQGFTYPVKSVGVVVATQYNRSRNNMNFWYKAKCCVHSL